MVVDSPGATVTGDAATIAGSGSSLEPNRARQSEGRIDRGLWWSDAAFYGALASTAAFVALMNLYAREAKWWDPKR